MLLGAGVPLRRKAVVPFPRRLALAANLAGAFGLRGTVARLAAGRDARVAAARLAAGRAARLATGRAARLAVWREARGDPGLAFDGRDGVRREGLAPTEAGRVADAGADAGREARETGEAGGTREARIPRVALLAVACAERGYRDFVPTRDVFDPSRSTIPACCLVRNYMDFKAQNGAPATRLSPPLGVVAAGYSYRMSFALARGVLICLTGLLLVYTWVLYRDVRRVSSGPGRTEEARASVNGMGSGGANGARSGEGSAIRCYHLQLEAPEAADEARSSFRVRETPPGVALREALGSGAVRYACVDGKVYRATAVRREGVPDSRFDVLLSSPVDDDDPQSFPVGAAAEEGYVLPPPAEDGAKAGGKVDPPYADVFLIFF